MHCTTSIDINHAYMKQCNKKKKNASKKKKEQTSHLDQAHNKFSSHNLQNFLFTYNLHCITRYLI